jgi:hypothetical protein
MGHAKSKQLASAKDIADTVYWLEIKAYSYVRNIESPELWKRILEKVMESAASTKSPVHDIKIRIDKKNTKRITGVIEWRSVMTDEYQLSLSLTVFLRGIDPCSDESYKIIPYRYKYKSYAV